jgi:hypothetical protein
MGIPEPRKLWGQDFDEVLGDSPDGALDRIVRRLLVPVADLTIGEVDRIAARAVEAGRTAILDAIEHERANPPGPSAMGDEPHFEPG